MDNEVVQRGKTLDDNEGMLLEILFRFERGTGYTRRGGFSVSREAMEASLLSNRGNDLENPDGEISAV